MKKYITMLLSLLLTFSLVSCGDSSSSSSKMPKKGSSVTLSQDSVVLTSKKNVDKFIDFLQAKNDKARDKMISNGEAVVIKKGQKVDIIDSGTVVKIEYNNKTYYAVYEAIH